MKCVSATLGLAFVSLFFAGCASVSTGTRQEVALASEPSAAQVIVYNNHGEISFQGVTPCVAKLTRTAPESDRANYTVLFKKEGFQDAQVQLKSRLNRAGAASAVLAGAGLLIDSDIGGAWTLCVETDEAKLLKQSSDILHPDGLCAALSPGLTTPTGPQVGAIQR